MVCDIDVPEVRRDLHQASPKKSPRVKDDIDRQWDDYRALRARERRMLNTKERVPWEPGRKA